MLSTFMFTRRGATVTAVLFAFVLTGCPPQPPTQTPLKQKLVAGGKFAEHTLYACLLNGLAQGLPIKRASDDCATKLLDASEGGGVGGIPGPIGGHDPFDPASVQANCSAGDPARTQTHSDAPIKYKSSGIKGFENTSVGGGEGYGYGSYGGKGHKDKDGSEYIGLSKEESEAQKKAAMEEAKKLLKEYLDLAEKANKETDPAKKKELEAKAKEADTKYKAAHSEASKDPNKKEPGVPNTRTAPDSICAQTLQAAREILFECNRNGWKTAQCQSLAAKMNHCPDPKYIYLDPEAGYACGEKIDPQAVKDAWSARCEELVKYGPGGTDPCQAPVVNDDGRYVEGSSNDICRDTRAYVDADSGACITTLEAKSPSGTGQPSMQELIVWALDKIGGPIVVLPRIPKTKPEPKPGTGPRPGPR
jgi:vacuolar-type H+-ATPase subunit H